MRLEGEERSKGEPEESVTPHRGTGAAQNKAMDGHATGIDGDQKGWRRVDRVLALAREPLDAVRGVKSLTGVPDWGLRVLARGCAD